MVRLLSHFLHELILLCMTSPSNQHTITFVFSRFTFNPLLYNALLGFRNLSFRPSIVSLINAKSSAYKVSFIKPFLHFLSQHPPQLQTTKVTKQILTFVFEPSYKLITAFTKISSSPFFLSAHCITLLGTLSNTFSKSTKHMYNFLSFSLYSSCIIKKHLSSLFLA